MLDSNTFDTIIEHGLMDTAAELHCRTYCWLTTPVQEQELFGMGLEKRRLVEGIHRTVVPLEGDMVDLSPDEAIVSAAERQADVLVSGDEDVHRLVRSRDLTIALWDNEQLAELLILHRKQNRGRG